MQTTPTSSPKSRSTQRGRDTSPNRFCCSFRRRSRAGERGERSGHSRRLDSDGRSSSFSTPLHDEVGEDAAIQNQKGCESLSPSRLSAQAVFRGTQNGAASIGDSSHEVRAQSFVAPGPTIPVARVAINAERHEVPCVDGRDEDNEIRFLFRFTPDGCPAVRGRYNRHACNPAQEPDRELYVVRDDLLPYGFAYVTRAGEPFVVSVQLTGNFLQEQASGIVGVSLSVEGRRPQELFTVGQQLSEFHTLLSVDPHGPGWQCFLQKTKLYGSLRQKYVGVTVRVERALRNSVDRLILKRKLFFRVVPRGRLMPIRFLARRCRAVWDKLPPEARTCRKAASAAMGYVFKPFRFLSFL